MLGRGTKNLLPEHREKQIRLLSKLEYCRQSNLEINSYLRIRMGMDPDLTIKEFQTKSINKYENQKPEDDPNGLIAQKMDALFPGGKCKVSEDETQLLLLTAQSLSILQERNAKLRAERRSIESTMASNIEKFKQDIEDLNDRLQKARKGHWCRKQVKQWEPNRDPTFIGKKLAMEGGPRSPPRGDDPRIEHSEPAACSIPLRASIRTVGNTGIVRYVDSFPVPTKGDLATVKDHSKLV